jgi:CRISPR-associated protein Cmr3
MSITDSSSTIVLDAFDTLFFRDGKPFSMGDDTWADGIFPPPPSVISGALRTGYFSHHIDRLSAAATVANPTGQLCVTGICYKLIPDNNYFYPAPHDIAEPLGKSVKLKRQEARSKRYTVEIRNLLFPAEGSISSMDSTYGLSTCSSDRFETFENGLVEINELTEYLCYGRLRSVIKLSDYLCLEPKVGIGRDNKTGTSSDTGKLYRVALLRPVSVGGKTRVAIVVGFKHLHLPEAGVLRFGAEGKCVSYASGKIPEIDITPLQQSESKRFKLYLSTPAVFDKGWKASWMESGEYNGLQFNLLGASIGRPLSLGGFNLKERRPKQMHKAVPPGSVYYFELKNGQLRDHFAEMKAAFHGKSLEDSASCTVGEGNGIAYLGVVQ